MNVGFFTLPPAPLIIFFSIAVSLIAGWLYSRRRINVDSAIFKSTAAGLILARISFVLHYFPAYRCNPLTILDFRDQVFDLIPGVIAGGCVLVWYFLRRRSLGGPLDAAMLVRVTVWSAASAVANLSIRSQSISTVSLVDVNGLREPIAGNEGRPTVLNLWATWCSPCQAEMPILAEAQASHPKQS
jgi:thiol-disulfide isomerase/thioredoxin